MGEGPAVDPVIVFNCPSCGQTIRVPRELAGKRGKCNQCGTDIDQTGEISFMDTNVLAQIRIPNRLLATLNGILAIK